MLIGPHLLPTPWCVPNTCIIRHDKAPALTTLSCLHFLLSRTIDTRFRFCLFDTRVLARCSFPFLQIQQPKSILCLSPTRSFSRVDLRVECCWNGTVCFSLLAQFLVSSVRQTGGRLSCSLSLSSGRGVSVSRARKSHSMARSSASGGRTIVQV
jgi:hypothetical protein